MILVSFSSCKDSNLVFKTKNKTNKRKKSVNQFLRTVLQRHKIKRCLNYEKEKITWKWNRYIDKNSGNKAIYRKFNSALGLIVIDRVPISILLQVRDTVKLYLFELTKKFISSQWNVRITEPHKYYNSFLTIVLKLLW